MMTLRRYQNELMIVLALLLLLGAVIFKFSSSTTLENKSAEATESISRMEDIDTMKKLWDKNKAISQKLALIEKQLGSSKATTFEVKKKKAHIILENLNGTELNKVVSKQIASIPVQIQEIVIDRSGENYRLELRCKW